MKLLELASKSYGMNFVHKSEVLFAQRLPEIEIRVPYAVCSSSNYTTCTGKH